MVDPPYKGLKATFSPADRLTRTRVSTEPFDYSNRSQKVSNLPKQFRFSETAQARVQRRNTSSLPLFSIGRGLTGSESQPWSELKSAEVPEASRDLKRLVFWLTTFSMMSMQAEKISRAFAPPDAPGM